MKDLKEKPLLQNELYTKAEEQLNQLNDVIKKKNQDYKDYTIFMTNLNTSIGALAMSVQKLNNELPSHLSKYGKDLEDNNRKINDLQGKLAENQTLLDENNKEKQEQYK